MTLMDTFITQKKKTGGVLPKIAAFVSEAFDPLGVKTTYYGYIHDIWDLDYSARL
jgi:hypothetical protein